MSRHKSLPTTTGLASGSLESYIRFAYSAPILSEQEEQSLARAYQEEQNLEAAHRLVISHLRFVIRTAKQYMGYGLALADLIQEGTVGLMKAVKRFDPCQGVRLVTFAAHWVRAEIHEFIVRHWRIVKIATTKAQRKLFFNLRKLSSDVVSLGNQAAERIANTLDVPKEEVFRMHQRLRLPDLSMEAQADQDAGSSVVAPEHYLASAQFSPARLALQGQHVQQVTVGLPQALKQLDDRLRYIIEQRWLSPEKANLETVGQKLGLSAERVRQLEAKALSELKKLLKDPAFLPDDALDDPQGVLV